MSTADATTAANEALLGVTSGDLRSYGAWSKYLEWKIRSATPRHRGKAARERVAAEGVADDDVEAATGSNPEERLTAVPRDAATLVALAEKQFLERRAARTVALDALRPAHRAAAPFDAVAQADYWTAATKILGEAIHDTLLTRPQQITLLPEERVKAAVVYIEAVAPALAREYNELSAARRHRQELTAIRKELTRPRAVPMKAIPEALWRAIQATGERKLIFAAIDVEGGRDIGDLIAIATELRDAIRLPGGRGARGRAGDPLESELRVYLREAYRLTDDEIEEVRQASEIAACLLRPCRGSSARHARRRAHRRSVP